MRILCAVCKNRARTYEKVVIREHTDEIGVDVWNWYPVPITTID